MPKKLSKQEEKVKSVNRDSKLQYIEYMLKWLWMLTWIRNARFFSLFISLVVQPFICMLFILHELYYSTIRCVCVLCVLLEYRAIVRHSIPNGIDFNMTIERTENSGRHWAEILALYNCPKFYIRTQFQMIHNPKGCSMNKYDRVLRFQRAPFKAHKIIYAVQGHIH